MRYSERYMLNGVLLLGLPDLWERHRARDPREKQVKELGPMPSGQATEEQRQITTGPKRGKGTRKQRKGKR